MPAGLGLQGSAQDELLRLTGSTGNPFQTLTGAATTNNTGVYYGEQKIGQARLLIAGAVTGTNPTLTVNLQACSDAAGTGAVTIAAFPQATATQAGANVSVSPTAPPIVAFVMPAAKPYLRAQLVAGGTTPVFTNVAVLLDPTWSGTP